MGATLTTLSAVLKDDYIGPIREQIPQDSVLLTRLEKNEEDVVGKKAVVPLHTARNSGIGARADGGALPAAGYQGYTAAEYNLAYNYGRIQITGPSIRAASSNKGAFVKEADAEIQSMVKDLKEDINRQLHGDGSGVLALVNGDPGTASTTLTVDNPNAMYFNKNMKIDVVDPSSTTAGDGRSGCTGLIVSAKASTTTLTISTTLAAAVADNDYVARAGNYALEMMGLKGIVNNANPRAGLKVGNIDRDTAGNEFWDANVFGNSGTLRKLTIDLMQQALDAAEEEGGKVSLILTGRAVRRKYAALVQADKRFVDTQKLDGGFKAVLFDDVPIVVDRHNLPTRMEFLDESTLQFYRMSDFEWMEEDGSVLTKVSGYDAYEAVLFLYATLGCSACNKNSVLDDIAI